MNFGKYFGEVVENIVRADPGYIQYCMKFDGGSKFGPDVLQLMEILSEKELEEAEGEPRQIPF